MTSLRDAAAFLLPWTFSPAVFLACVGALVLYARGLASGATHEPIARRMAFSIGVALVYAVMQTRFDYLSQHMFFIHRLQHLVLHHLGPFLIALSAPARVLAAGRSREAKRAVRSFPGARYVRAAYRVVQHPVVAPVLFVGLIAFWLTPTVHFAAMLNATLYDVMNWSMLLDGLLFWMLILDPRTRAEGALIGLGARILIVLAAIVPQILIGAHITFASTDLYDVYEVCGRAWDLPAGDDQRIGGLIIWIPAAMMHVVAALVLLRRWMHADAARTAVSAATRARG